MVDTAGVTRLLAHEPVMPTAAITVSPATFVVTLGAVGLPLVPDPDAEASIGTLVLTPE